MGTRKLSATKTFASLFSISKSTCKMRYLGVGKFDASLATHLTGALLVTNKVVHDSEADYKAEA